VVPFGDASGLKMEIASARVTLTSRLRSPQDLLATELKEIHSAERQLTRALPRLAKQVTSHLKMLIIGVNFNR
jgi:Domain of unknown function (DUF892)